MDEDDAAVRAYVSNLWAEDWTPYTWRDRVTCLVLGHAPRGHWKPECLRCGKEAD